jgi:succinyl-CoA:acetate CoA-transferase
MAGYPKAVVEALIERKKSGEELLIELITAANAPWLDDKLGGEQVLSGRAPMCASRTVASQANNGSLRYVEQQMSRMTRLLRRGSFGKIDVAVIEALGFDKNGNLIPTTSIGMAHHLMNAADQIVIEINSAPAGHLVEAA